MSDREKLLKSTKGSVGLFPSETPFILIGNDVLRTKHFSSVIFFLL